MTVSMTPHNDRIQIAILGSGIAGTALALGLQNDSVVRSLCDLWIFEAFPKPRDEEGHGVVNGYDNNYSAHLIGSEEVMGDRPDNAKLDNVSGAVPVESERDVSPHGPVLHAMEAAGMTYHDHTYSMSLGSGPGKDTIWEPKPLTIPPHFTVGGVRRGRFSGEMRKAWEAANESGLMAKDARNRRVQWGKALTHITQQNSGQKDGRPRQILHFADGTSFEADIVMGCDGVNSKTRPVVLEPYGAKATVTATSTHGVMLRKIIPRKEAERIFGDFCRPKCQRAASCDGVFLLTDWLDDGQSFQVIADWAHSGWPEGETRSLIPWDKDRARRELLEFGIVGKLFAQVFDPEHKEDVTDIEPHTAPTSDLLAWSRRIHLDAPPSAVHPVEPICLVGDAAQAFQPYAGAGAGNAIQDGLILSTLVRMVCRQHKSKSDNGQKKSALIDSIRTALQAYSTTRLPRRSATAARAEQRSWKLTCQGDIGDDPVKWKEYAEQIAASGGDFSATKIRSEIWDMIEQAKGELQKLTDHSA